jgi:uroporphyrinogen-III decarboxylase
MLPENFAGLSPDEKMEARFAEWMSTEDKEFASPEAALAYERRTRRYCEAVRLKEPDRVPVVLNVGGYVGQYTGTPHRAFFYDYEKAGAAMAAFYEEFDLEYQVNGNLNPGKALDRVGYKLFSWPGGKLPDDRPFQCEEREYMTADEYDALIADPSAFMMRTFMPRVFQTLGGLGMLPNFIGATELPTTAFMMLPMGAPPVVAAFEALMEAGKAAQEWIGAVAGIQGPAQAEKGLPGTMGGFTKAPFDYIGDTLRGTHGIMLDMYRHPEKLIEACNRLVPIAVNMAVNGANQSGKPMILIPLHKGADGFMSSPDFEKFYWPSLKATILGLIEEGIVPLLFVEGGYNQRLDIIADAGLPVGKTIWYFDQTDMAAAKEKIGGWACISGNVPASLFKAGTPAQMEDGVKKLMDTAAPGGGYFIANGAILDDAEADNVHAYLKAGKTYGVY